MSRTNWFTWPCHVSSTGNRLTTCCAKAMPNPKWYGYSAENCVNWLDVSHLHCFLGWKDNDHIKYVLFKTIEKLNCWQSLKWITPKQINFKIRCWNPTVNLESKTTLNWNSGLARVPPTWFANLIALTILHLWPQSFLHHSQNCQTFPLTLKGQRLPGQPTKTSQTHWHFSGQHASFEIVQILFHTLEG